MKKEGEYNGIRVRVMRKKIMKKKGIIMGKWTIKMKKIMKKKGDYNGKMNIVKNSKLKQEIYYNETRV